MWDEWMVAMAYLGHLVLVVAVVVVAMVVVSERDHRRRRRARPRVRGWDDRPASHGVDELAERRSRRFA